MFSAGATASHTMGAWQKQVLLLFMCGSGGLCTDINDVVLSLQTKRAIYLMKS